MQQVFKMAGGIAAHSVWGVSSGETLIPMLATMDRDNRSLLRRIAFDDAKEAHQFGKNSLERNESGARGAAFAVDGYITLTSGKYDALILDVRVYMDAVGKAEVVIPYRHAKDSEGFAIFRPKLTVLEKINPSDVDVLMNAFYEGLENHEQGYAVWQKYFKNEA